MKFRNALPFLLKIAVAVSLLLAIFHFVPFSKVKGDLARLEPGRLTVLLALYWLAQMMCAQRWRLFARPLGLAAPYFTFVRMEFAAMFFGLGLPSSIGGDVVKAYMLARKSKASLTGALASVVQDRVAGLIFLLLLGTAAALLFPLHWRGVNLILIYVLVWLGTAATLMIAAKAESLVPLERLRAFGRIGARLADLHGQIVVLRFAPGDALQVALLGLANSALVLWIAQQIAEAAGFRASLAGFAALIPLIEIITLAPVSISGLGVREWAYVEGLALIGFPPDQALAVALASSALLIARNLAGALFLAGLPVNPRAEKQ